ncbi:MAG: mechanosensitive ion channel [bacterium]|nr:mechanosensitive ion channel [bacterium]
MLSAHLLALATHTWPQVLGIAIAITCGFLLSWASKRYKKKAPKPKLVWLNQLIHTTLHYGYYLISLVTLAIVGKLWFSDLTLVYAALQLSLFIFLANCVWNGTRNIIISALVVVFGILSWTLNQLNMLGSLGKKINALAIPIGSITINPITLLKAIGLIGILAWGISVIMQWLNKHIKKNKRLKSSTKALLSKSLEIVLYLLLLIIGLRVLGIDLTALTVIFGFLGVGIGFGLQRIAANFISGIILLFENAFEVDDLIEMDGGIYGFIRQINARYTRIETFDGKEIMVPNEDFITHRVTNWTYSNAQGRIEINVGVAYDSDIKHAQALILDAAKSHPQCSQYPEPEVHLRTFGDNAVNFLLFLFVDDVTQGRYAIQSEVMIMIWNRFKANNISIPFPQRDIHIKHQP